MLGNGSRGLGTVYGLLTVTLHLVQFYISTPQINSEHRRRRCANVSTVHWNLEGVEGEVKLGHPCPIPHQEESPSESVALSNYLDCCDPGSRNGQKISRRFSPRILYPQPPEVSNVSSI